MPRSSRRSAALFIQILGWPLLALLAAARLGARRQARLLDLVDTWASYPLAGWPLLALLAGWTRSRALGLLAGAGAALALDSGRRIVGRSARPRLAGSPRLRVLTANVLAKNLEVAGLAELIERERPDFVCLQEVRHQFLDDVLARLGAALPYRELRPHPRFGGAALLSRWPLEQARSYLLAGQGHYCQRARLNVAGRRLHVFNIHLDTPYEIRSRPAGFPRFTIRRRARHARDAQIEALLEQLTALDGPVLVCGDFNSAAGSRPHRLLLRHLRDAFLEVGRGFGHTFPQPTPIYGLLLPFPVLRIDYVFFTGGLEPLRARTLAHRGSDHRAILADLSLSAVPANTATPAELREAAAG